MRAFAMKAKGFSFTFFATLLLGFFSIAILGVEGGRISPDLYQSFFWLKVSTSVVCVLLAAILYFRGVNDLLVSIFFTTCVAYSLSMMWYAPLYEISYVQFAVGCAFIPLRRRWLFPVFFGLGLLGILLTYVLQDRLGWVLPKVTRSDWMFVSLIFFLLAAIIQKFAIENERRRLDRLKRFAMIGREATRLLHDLKGLLSSPVLLLDAIQESKDEPHQREVEALVRDLRHALGAIQSIHLMVSGGEGQQRLNVLDALKSSTVAIKRRLAKVTIKWPQPRFVRAVPSNVHSVFFSAFVFALECFERCSSSQPEIAISWRDQDRCLVFSINAPADESNCADHIELVSDDLVSIGAKLEIESNERMTTYKIHFNEVSNELDEGTDATA